MLDVNVKLIRELKKFVCLVAENEVLLDKFRCFGGDFSRNRKLPFSEVVLLIARLCRKTLSVELEEFFAELGVERSCSVSAFCQQRHKLGASFFYCWNAVLCACYYELYAGEVKRWKGYRVVAGDGSSVRLVNTPELRAYFGGQTNQHELYVMGKTFYCYDVLNKVTIHSFLAPYSYGEVPMAYKHIDWLESDMVTIWDRNFFSYKLMYLHLSQEREIKFVIRAKEKLVHIASFIASGESSRIIELYPSSTMKQGLRESGYIVSSKTAIKVRLVRVELKDMVEVLATNLWEEEGHSASEFKAIYFMRWGIETGISFQKNILQLEAFSGCKINTVLQDFYATVFTGNLHNILIKGAQATVDEQRGHKKYPQQVNNNKSFGKLRKRLVQLFCSQEVLDILKTLHHHFIRDALPVRKGRTFERVRKNPQCRSKHRMFTNYKPSF